MTRLSHYFISALALLIIIFGLILVMLMFEKKSSAIKNFSKLTTLPGLALSVKYFEPRNRFYADNREALFMEMKPIRTMDFIYAE